MNNLLRRIILKTPRVMRSPLIRSTIRFPSEIDPRLRFKVAETKDELEQAFALLHDAYVKENLMQPHPSGLRVTKYHALPSTTTLIAVENHQVIGTLSLVRQSAFGMPLENIFSLDHLPPGSRAAEVSSLAIKNGMQQQRGRILFPLLKFMYHYSIEYFGVTHFVIAVNPKWYDFYESVLLFNKLSMKTVDSYDFVNGAPAIGGVLELKRAQRQYRDIYGGKSVERNLSHFFQELEADNLELPLRKKSMISDPVMSPELIDHFFIQRTHVFDKLNDFEKTVLRQLYNTDDYLQLIPKPDLIQMNFRKEKRFDARLHGRIYLGGQRTVSLEIQTVSKSGLGGFLKFPLPKGSYTLQVNLEDHEACQVEGKLLWVNERGHFGFAIENVSPSWNKYIGELNSRLVMESSSLEIAKKVAP